MVEEKHLKAAGVKDPAKWLEAVQKTCEEFGINTPQRIASFVAQCAQDRKSTRLNSSHTDISRMPSSA